MKLTLPTDSAVRKDIPLRTGCYEYFPAALMRVAMISKIGNDKHNPGEPLHHARGKSMDHGDCIERHLMDIADMLASLERYDTGAHPVEREAVLTEAGYLCWRALALSQELHERFGAPLAPAARLPKTPEQSPIADSMPTASESPCSGRPYVGSHRILAEDPRAGSALVSGSAPLSGLDFRGPP